MLLAVDLGGTKTLVGLFDRGVKRPTPVAIQEYPTTNFDSLDHIVQTFAREHQVSALDAICAGVAGPVTGSTARLTNVPWTVDVDEVASHFNRCPVALLNDLEAMATSVAVLQPDELCTLQQGAPADRGNAAVIAAGTGMGQALIHDVGGRLVPLASEGGHADFAARTPREYALAETIQARHGRAEVEQVLSGPGLVNIFRFTHTENGGDGRCPTIDSDVPEDRLPILIGRSALEGTCARCVDALKMFVEAYGAEAGNVGLRAMAVRGVFVGGGIAPKILPFIENGAFMKAFNDKAPLTALATKMPVHVILNDKAGLVGAAVRAAQISTTRT
jgi:glucokinase